MTSGIANLLAVGGPDNLLEDDVTAAAVDGVPDAAQSRPPFDRDKGKPFHDRDKPTGKGPGKPPRKPKGTAGDAPPPARRSDESPTKPAPRSNSKSDAKPGFKGKTGKPGPRDGSQPPRRKG